jgi:hypothetical protein
VVEERELGSRPSSRLKIAVVKRNTDDNEDERRGHISELFSRQMGCLDLGSEGKKQSLGRTSRVLAWVSEAHKRRRIYED